MIFVATPVMLLTALWPDLSLAIPRLLGFFDELHSGICDERIVPAAIPQPD